MLTLISRNVPSSLKNTPEMIAFVALAGCISLVQISIAASQILLALSIVGLVWMLKRRDRSPIHRTPVLVPLCAFISWTMVAIFASSNVAIALTATRKFYLLLLLLLVPILLGGGGRFMWICRAVFSVAAISSIWGLAQFAANPNRDLLNRIKGSMSQWMTYSGLLMLVLVLLTAYALCVRLRKNRWIIPVSFLIVVALALTLTRNVWVGAILGMGALITMRRPRALVILLAAVLLCYIVSPGIIRQRVKSIMDTNDPRIHVWMTAMHVIQDNPWVGLGPKNVNIEAPKYRDEREFPDWLQKFVGVISTAEKYQKEETQFPGWLYQHMHNNLLQIAAETGIPGLILWLWLMVRLAWDALHCYRHAQRASSEPGENPSKEAMIASSAALAAWIALMSAGMFEYNFGDSEVLTLFLFIVSAPYAFMPPRGESVERKVPV